MIKELDKNNKKELDELENSFSYVLKSVSTDFSNNPFSHYLLFV